MRLLVAAVAFAGASVAPALSQPFDEITIGIPVPSLESAEAWYRGFLDPDVEVIEPAPGVVEFKVAPGVWLQLLETEGGASTVSIVRFSVEDTEEAQARFSKLGYDTGEAVAIPDVVTFSEFQDPFGNALGLYSVP